MRDYFLGFLVWKIWTIMTRLIDEIINFSAIAIIYYFSLFGMNS